MNPGLKNTLLLIEFGALYLAMAYRRTGSVMYTAILHGILGMFVFTFGMGEFFWLNMYDYL